jgi:hypothetical protein
MTVMRVLRSVTPATLALLLALAGCGFVERREATTSDTPAEARGTALPALRRVMVIWLPVIESDQGPPTDTVRGPLQDPRVIEFWDPQRWASPRMMERATLMVRARGEEPDFEPDAIAWDLIALFPAGVAWDEPFPTPTWWNGPVVDGLGPVETLLVESR